MAHKEGFEALSRIPKGIRGNDSVMGGFTVLLAGGIRKTLPVVPRGYLWPHITKSPLRKNMQVHLKGDATFGDFPESEDKTTIPVRLCSVFSTMANLIDLIYPHIANVKEKPMKNKIAQRNRWCSPLPRGVSKPTWFACAQTFFKVWAPEMLLRNLKPPKLYNGAKLWVKALRRNGIEVTVFTDCAQGKYVFIPRVPISAYPFEFKKRQFPLKLCVCVGQRRLVMEIINKCN